jgi:small GTP-binding protein
MTSSQLSLRTKSISLLSLSTALHSSILPNASALPTSFSSTTAFSAVIAGEFNAGKSTFINALVGGEMLKSGPLPTTDTLCLLSTMESDDDAAVPNYSPPTVVATPLPSNEEVNVDVTHVTLSHVYGSTHSLLSSVTLIDTPGTNAVSELNHDALTKRLLPAADVVLFVTSADQPLSQSERDLLSLIHSWNKKTIIVLNKVDVLPDEVQRDQVINFVATKVSQIFSSAIDVIPVSSRKALDAKILASRDRVSPDAGVGASSFLTSGFPELESKLAQVLSEDNKVTQKLLSPVGLTESVLGEAKTALKEKYDVLEGDLTTLKLLKSQMSSWRNDIDNEVAKTTGNVNETFADAVDDGQQHILKAVKLVEIMYPDEQDSSQNHPVQRLYQSLVSTKLVPPLQSVIRRTASSLSTKGKTQSVSIVEYLGKRPLHYENSIISNTNSASVSINSEEIYGRMWAEVEQADIFGKELKETIGQAWEDARNRMVMAGGAGALGSGGGCYFLVAGSLADPLTLAGLGSSALLIAGGAAAIARTRTTIQAMWRKELIESEASVNKRVAKILEKAAKGEVDRIADTLSMQVGPFGGYIEQEALGVKEKLVECQKLINENNDVRNQIIDESESLFNFTGGWRSEKKLM